MVATQHAKENARLEALYRTELLDSSPEPEFDELVEIAAAICGAPMSMVSLVDRHRQWFKATVGVEAKETSREVSFCAHAILQDGLFTVEDATKDVRFKENELVTGEFGLRFYAGFPVSSPDGFHLGSLCVLDRKPHQLNEAQKTALKTLARQVNARIELRMKRREVQLALASAEHARARLLATDRRFKAFMNSGPFVGFLKDSEGRYLSYNQAFAGLFQISLGDWIGKTDDELFPADYARVYRANDLEVVKTMETIVSLEETANADGSKTCWRSYKFPCPSDDGSTLVGGIALDVTEEIVREGELRRSKVELEEANRQLRELAATDPLTGLANRRVFDERLTLEFARSRRKKLGLAVLMIDVDNFKQCNDKHGHAHGDEVLRQLSNVLRECVRETDLAARYGGEEFVVLFPEADEVQALEKAQQMIDALHAERWAYGPCTVSIGAASLDDATPNPQRLVTLADEALYAAKRAGKDRAVGYRAYYRQLIAELKEQRPAAE